MPIVKFIKEKKEIEVAAGANLRQEAIKAGINVYHGINGVGATINKYVNCHGLGACGTCRVLITKGMQNTNPQTFCEKAKFRWMAPMPLPDPLPAMAYIGHEDTMRLACCTVVNGDIEVETGPDINMCGDNFFS